MDYLTQSKANAFFLKPIPVHKFNMLVTYPNPTFYPILYRNPIIIAMHVTKKTRTQTHSLIHI